MRNIKISLTFIAILFTFMSCGNDNVQTVSLWFQPMSSEADFSVPPKDWIGYQEIRDELGINLKLKALPTSSSESDKVILESAYMDNLPDMFFVSTSALQELILSDKIIPVGDLIGHMPERAKALHYEDFANITTFNNKVYGFTTAGSIPRNEGFVIRKDWLDNLGLDVPKTYEDFLKTMYMFTHNDPDGNGIDDTYGFGAYIECNTYEDWLGKKFSPIFTAFGCNGTYDVENRMLNINKPEFYKAMKSVQYLNESNLIDPNWVIYTKSSFRNAWKAGRFGCMREQFAALYKRDNYESFDKNFPNGEWIIIEPFTRYTRDGVLTSEPYVGVDAPSTRTLVISKRCLDKGNVATVCNLLEWMSTKGYNLINYGQEGVNYTYVNGKISDVGVPVPYTCKEFTPYRQLTNLVTSYSPREQELNYVTHTSINGKTINVVEKLKEMQSKNWRLAAIGMPTCSITFRDRYRDDLVEFASGRKDLTEESWNEWLSTFNRNGGADWERAINTFADEHNYPRN